MILLWGMWHDGPLRAVARALQRAGARVARVDQFDVLRTQVDLAVDREVRGAIRTAGRGIDLAEVTAVYPRTYDWREVPALGSAAPGGAEWRHALAVSDAVLCWLELTPALVVNPLAAMATNNSKPYQAGLIRSAGFAVPDTLITTDPAAALEFWEKHVSVVYKSLSGVRSIVSRLTRAHAARLADVVWCPTQFQEHVPGPDYRVHVVGGELFCCEIASAADDYRYAGRQGATVEMRSFEPDAELADRCRDLAAALGLHVAGIDLRRSRGGEWYCFEVNPSPAFTYFEDATGQPIARAIARFLTAAPSGGRKKESKHDALDQDRQKRRAQEPLAGAGARDLSLARGAKNRGGEGRGRRDGDHQGAGRARTPPPPSRCARP